MRPFIDRTPQIRAIGGGSHSALWCQIQADMFNSQVVTLAAGNGPAYGAASLAAVGIGMYNSIVEVTDHWVSIANDIDPDPVSVRRYNELYERYIQLYKSLKPRFDES